MEKKLKFLIYRDSGNGTNHYERFEVPVLEGASILNTLF